MWIDRSERTKGESRLVDDVTRFGSLMVWQLWQPNAVFGLAPLESARLGTVTRMQFDCIESSFLEWRRKPDCVKSDNEEMLVFTPAPRLKTRVLDVQRKLFGG